MAYRTITLIVFVLLMGVTLTAAFFDSLYWAAAGAVLLPILVVIQVVVVLFAKEEAPLPDRQNEMYEND
ncbi:MAG: hypothetical protein D6816_00790 [Bacteroidetes bacterium]|jgi:nitrate/nitrite transporter NarK|nr:MAG: hypothetical protein D6816_00790 [Bacteroidota bacterium]